MQWHGGIAKVVVEQEMGIYRCIQRVVRRAFLCGVDPLTQQSFEHRKDGIRDRLEALAGLFGVEIAAFAVMSNRRVEQGHPLSIIPEEGGWLYPLLSGSSYLRGSWESCVV